MYLRNTWSFYDNKKLTLGVWRKKIFRFFNRGYIFSRTGYLFLDIEFDRDRNYKCYIDLISIKLPYNTCYVNTIKNKCKKYTWMTRLIRPDKSRSLFQPVLSIPLYCIKLSKSLSNFYRPDLMQLVLNFKNWKENTINFLCVLRLMLKYNFYAC